MLESFSWSTYGLMAIVIALHYPIGYFLGIKRPLQASLTGLCFSALIVAIFANLHASSIRAYIYSSLLLLLPTSGFLLYRLRKHISLNQVLTYLPVPGFAILFFIFNEPHKVFLSNDDNGLLLSFNDHYTYYASQSVEMLNAEYGSRLRSLSLYPREWAVYHFFNASTQAILQIFCETPRLMTYLMAQLLLCTLILASFLETIVATYKSSLRLVVATIFWLFLGFSFFQSSLVWSLKTTGTFSVFAIFFLIQAIVAGDAKNKVLYGAVLGASAFRLLPVAGPVMAIVLLYGWYEQKKSYGGSVSGSLIKYCQKSWNMLLLPLITGIYAVVTVFSGSSDHYGPANPFFTRVTYSDDWMYSLSFHHFFYFLSETLSLLPSWFSMEKGPDSFARLGESLPLALIFGFGCFVAILSSLKILLPVIFSRLQSLGRMKTATLLALTTLTLLAAGTIAPKLTFISLCYLIATLSAVLYLNRKKAGPVVIVSVICLTTWALILTGCNGIKAPVAYTTFDLTLWCLLFLVLMSQRLKLSSFIIMFCMIIGLKPAYRDLFRYSEQWKMPLSEFQQERFQPYVTPDGSLNREIIAFSDNNGKTLEGFAIVFGGRTQWGTGRWWEYQRTYRHLAKIRNKNKESPDELQE